MSNSQINCENEPGLYKTVDQYTPDCGAKLVKKVFSMSRHNLLKLRLQVTCMWHMSARLRLSHQRQHQSGRALEPPGPGIHCSTVMSPLPVGVGGRRGVWQGGKKHRSAKLSDKEQKKKKEQSDDRWRESPIKASTADSTLCHRHRLSTGPTNKINEPLGLNKIQLSSTTDSWQSLYTILQTGTRAFINFIDNNTGTG